MSIKGRKILAGEENIFCQPTRKNTLFIGCLTLFGNHNKTIMKNSNSMILTTGSELYVGYMIRHHITHLNTDIQAFAHYWVIWLYVFDIFEDRQHLRKTQINLVFRSVYTIFATRYQ